MEHKLLPVVVIFLTALLVFSPMVSALFENDVVIQPGGGSGTPGAPGLNASCNGNLTVNSTTTLPPGSSATVVSAWNGTWAAMDFGIPQGAKGDKGDPGDSGGDSSQFYLLNTTRSLTGQEIYRNTTNSNLNLFGGTNVAGAGGIVSVQGSDLSSDSIVFYVPDMTKTANLIVAKFVGITSTPYLHMNSRQIKSLADPTDAQDAATMAHVTSVNNSQTLNTSLAIVASNWSMRYYVDSRTSDILNYLLLNGTRAMTGNLSMGTNYITGLQDPSIGTDAATKNYVDTHGGISDHGLLSNLSGDGHLQYLLIAGTRAMTGNLSMGSNYITGLILPSVGTDAANKLYVDNVNNSQTLNGSYADYALNTTMNLNTSLAIVAANNSMKAYADALNESQRLNTSYFHASKVAGKVPTAELGSGAASSSTYLRGDQTWATPAGGASTVYNYYTIPFQALTNSPGDNAVNYIGGRPIAPSTTANTNKMVIPTSGVVERVEVYDYSGTAGTAETYGYYVMLNGATEYWINNLTVAASERIFSNSTIRFNVAAGDYIEIKRKHPAWATNPLTNIVGGYVLINQTATSSLGGYTLPVMALTSSPTDAQTVYFGNMPKAPVTAAGTSKVFIPRDGTISRVEVYCYSGTAGTAESWTMSIGVNASYTTVATVTNALNERIFRNASLSIPVTAGQYIEMRGVQPTWATNPATTIYGGYVYVT